MLERTLCGLELTRDSKKTKKTPYRHACKCSPFYSSAPTCHRCSCVKCTTERARWDKHIASGGLLVEQARDRKHAK